MEDQYEEIIRFIFSKCLHIVISICVICFLHLRRQKWGKWLFDGSSPWGGGREDPPGIRGCTLHTYFHWLREHYISVTPYFVLITIIIFFIFVFGILQWIWIVDVHIVLIWSFNVQIDWGPFLQTPPDLEVNIMVWEDKV